MLKGLKNKLWKMEGQENIETPNDTIAKFSLMYEGFTIGYLTLEAGIWKFRYSEEYKKNPVVIPIVDFPNIMEEYANKNLWPFFAYRIPGLNQPSVQDIIKEEDIDESNEVELLKKFGKYTIYNPYKLEYAT